MREYRDCFSPLCSWQEWIFHLAISLVPLWVRKNSQGHLLWRTSFSNAFSLLQLLTGKRICQNWTIYPQVTTTPGYWLTGVILCWNGKRNCRIGTHNFQVANRLRPTGDLPTGPVRSAGKKGSWSAFPTHWAPTSGSLLVRRDPGLQLDSGSVSLRRGFSWGLSLMSGGIVFH